MKGMITNKRGRFESGGGGGDRALWVYEAGEQTTNQELFRQVMKKASLLKQPAI